MRKHKCEVSLEKSKSIFSTSLVQSKRKHTDHESGRNNISQVSKASVCLIDDDKKVDNVFVVVCKEEELPSDTH